MVHGEQGHHRVGGVVAERDGFRGGLEGRAAPGGRWAIIVELGSTASTVCGGS